MEVLKLGAAWDALPVEVQAALKVLRLYEEEGAYNPTLITNPWRVFFRHHGGAARVPLKTETTLEMELRHSQEALRGIVHIAQLPTLTQDEKVALVLRRASEALRFTDVLGRGGL